ncbi:hypothetical protein, partial [Sphingomonas koreensis]|uniref:hypothetical protein n=1 Tax=Sphingomonas koreensis TaxID=93064 RepID=UPI0019D25BCF
GIMRGGQCSCAAGGTTPLLPEGFRALKTALSSASIAGGSMYDRKVPNDLSLHAGHDSAGRRRRRVVSIGNTIFYR